jgi:hypothetical protein
MPSPEEVENECSACSVRGCLRRSPARFMVWVRIARPRRHKQRIRIDGRCDLINQIRFMPRNGRVGQTETDDRITADSKGLRGTSLLNLPMCA